MRRQCPQLQRTAPFNAMLPVAIMRQGRFAAAATRSARGLRQAVPGACAFASCSRHRCLVDAADHARLGHRHHPACSTWSPAQQGSDCGSCQLPNIYTRYACSELDILGPVIGVSPHAQDSCCCRPNFFAQGVGDWRWVWRPLCCHPSDAALLAQRQVASGKSWAEDRVFMMEASTHNCAVVSGSSS